MLQYRGGNQHSPEEVFHKLLSQLTPETYELKRLSIFECPIRAELEYVKPGSKSRQFLSLELKENQKAINYHISPAQSFWPWTKSDFDKHAIKALDKLKVS